MINCWSFYADLRKMKIGEERANEIEDLARKYMVTNAEKDAAVENAVTEYKEKIEELEKKVAAQEKLLANPNLQIERIVEKVIRENLSLDSECEAYSGSYARLYFGKEILGSVCLRSYDDD